MWRQKLLRSHENRLYIKGLEPYVFLNWLKNIKIDSNHFTETTKSFDFILAMYIRRNSIIEDTLKEFGRYGEEKLHFRIEFVKEPGVDQGNEIFETRGGNELLFFSR